MNYENDLFLPQKHYHEPTVEINDGGEPALRESLVSRVHVVDVNESPSFNPGSIAFNILNTATVGEEVGPVIFASDEDENDILLYSIDGTDEFEIKNISNGGILVTNGASLAGTYKFNVTATDIGSASATLSVSVTVIQTSQNKAPQMNSSVVFHVNEDVAPGSAVANVAGYDPDGDRLTYTVIKGNEDQLFTIDRVSGIVTYRGSSHFTVDFERRSLYSVFGRLCFSFPGPRRTTTVG